MCVFENEEIARKFTERKSEEPLLLTTKTMSELAKEFNSSIVWHGMAGIAYVDNKGMVDHIDVDEFIKMAFSDIGEPNKSYGCRLIVNDKIANIKNIDFNKKYFIMFNTNGHLVTDRTKNENGKRRNWLVVTTRRSLLKNKVAEFGIKKYNQEIVKESLSYILSYFQPGEFLSNIAGIEYIDENGIKMIPRKKINEILKEREKLIEELREQTKIYLDEHYFLVANRYSNCPISSEKNGTEFLLVSQRMDTMMKTLMLDGMDPAENIFMNMLTMREILEDFPKNCGILLCLDDNPDHTTYLSLDAIMEMVVDGTSDEDESDDYIYADDKYMLSDRFTMMEGDNYTIIELEPISGGELLNVVVVANRFDVLLDGLDNIDYCSCNDIPTERPMYEIFSEFREGNQLECCDAMFFLEDDGLCRVIPRRLILEVLNKWERKGDN